MCYTSITLPKIQAGIWVAGTEISSIPALNAKIYLLVFFFVCSPTPKNDVCFLSSSDSDEGTDAIYHDIKSPGV
jgi:hypothetical protein